MKQLCERIHNAMSKGQDGLAVKLLTDYIEGEWAMRETMTISSANGGAMQNFTIWKADVIGAIEKMKPEINEGKTYSYNHPDIIKIDLLDEVVAKIRKL